MNRDWYDFKSLYSNFAGARMAFENACESLIRFRNPTKNVKSVRIKHGDGGIDIFMGNYGIAPIDVFQCKYFLDNIGQSQKTQINQSFKKAIRSTKYQLKSWTLCISKEFDIDEHDWFYKWKSKKENEFSLNVDFIKLMSGNELIDLMKNAGIYNQVFKIDDSLKIAEIHDFTKESSSTIGQLKDIEETKLKLSVKPELWITGTSTSGSDGEMKIDLFNKGESALLSDFRLISNDIHLHSLHLPYTLEKGKHRFIFGRTKGQKNISKCEYTIEIYYQDKLQNKYLTKIEGKGAKAKITETSEID
ncbi:MAG: hypothetical protein KAV44_00805 [Bacteroidales bacterium]|jgi:hypothetical protein|nr:hypothetical protein [Bacteroidales bacterium]